jgi:pimeloyl-ACP methyl ester esterase
MPDFTAADGSVIVYSDHGAGIPVLFLHGWMMSRKAWSFQEQLSGQFRVITMELRGHGDSSAHDFSYDNCINDISELLAHLRIDRAVIAGWSMGAQIAMRFYTVMSRKVAGMILVGGTPCFCKKDDYAFGVPQSEVRSMFLRLKRDYKSTSGEFFKAMFSDGEVSKPGLVAIANRTIGRLPDYSVAIAALQALADSDLRSLLRNISVPVLLVHGSDDRICPPGASEYMSSRIPGARLELIDNIGHAPFLSCPERFNALITGFVQSL